MKGSFLGHLEGPQGMENLAGVGREGLYQIVQFWVIAEEGFVLLLLLVDKVLDVHVKAGGGDALRALGGLFTFLKQQRQKREKRVPVGTARAHTCAQKPAAGWAQKP